MVNQANKKPVVLLQMEVHPKEAELLLLVRETFKWGQIEIECRNGLPDYVVRTVKRHLIEPRSDLSTEIRRVPEFGGMI